MRLGVLGSTCNFVLFCETQCKPFRIKIEVVSDGLPRGNHVATCKRFRTPSRYIHSDPTSERCYASHSAKDGAGSAVVTESGTNLHGSRVRIHPFLDLPILTQIQMFALLV